LTSAPIAFFVARAHGLEFAATTAAGTMAGAVSQAAFGLAYAWLAGRWPWPAALAAGTAAFAASTAVLAVVVLPPPALGTLVFAALAGAVRLMPASGRVSDAVVRLPAWDLPGRVVVATVLVLALTAAAEPLGARLTGLLAPFPLYATILTVFGHALGGPAAARDVLRGLLLGLFALTAFFLVLASMLPQAGIAGAFTAATGVALGLQGASLWLLRRDAPA
jgi:hypothetical protein